MANILKSGGVLTELINSKGDCRTAPATPDLLNMKIFHIVHYVFHMVYELVILTMATLHVIYSQ